MNAVREKLGGRHPATRGRNTNHRDAVEKRAPHREIYGSFHSVHSWHKKNVNGRTGGRKPIKARIHPKFGYFTVIDDAWSWLELLSAIILHLERQFIGIHVSARCTLKHNTIST